MKSLFWLLLAGSLALNVLWAFSFFGADSSAVSPPSVVESHPPESTPAAAAVEAATWAELQNAPWPELVTQLREAGFPPAFVRALVETQVREAYKERRRPFDAAPEAYWKIPSILKDPERFAALRQLEREETDEVRRLVGETSRDPLQALMSQVRFSGLPAEKVPPVEQMIREFNELRMDLRATIGVSSMLPEDFAKLQAIGQAERAELAKLLTPEELDQYELQSGQTAHRLRRDLVAFQPTEQEFLLIFEKERQFDQEYGGMVSSSEAMTRRMEATKTLQAEIKALLGPERGAEYERALDQNYRLTSQLAARLQLPPTTAPQVWAVQQAFQSRLQELRSNRELSAQQRSAQQAALLQDATAQLTPLLGERGLEFYKEYGGTWLRALAPPSPRPN